MTQVPAASLAEANRKIYTSLTLNSSRGRYGRNMLDVNLVELLTLVCALYAAVMGHRVQRRFDELAGKATTLEAGRHAHVNAPGLHH